MNINLGLFIAQLIILVLLFWNLCKHDQMRSDQISTSSLALSNSLSTLRQNLSQSQSSLTYQDSIITISQTNQNLEFYGDSVSVGQGVAVTERWTRLVSNKLNMVEKNYAQGGNQWIDCSQYLYKYHVAGTPVFLSYGINDVGRLQANNDQLRRNINALILYSTLPKANIVDPRIFVNSVWASSDLYPIGIFTTNSTTANTISTNLTGRYVAFSTTVLTGTTWSYHPTYNITVDGMSISQPAYETGTNNSANYSSFLWIYDTKSNAGVSHKVTIQVSSTGNYGGKIYIDYLAGFESNHSGTSPVLLLQPSLFDYHAYAQGQSYILDSQYRSMCETIKDSAYYFSSILGLPVMTVSRTLANDFGTLQSDLIHPTASGHIQLADRVTSFIQVQ